MDGGILYSLFTTPLGYYFFESCMKTRTSKVNIQYLYADGTDGIDDVVGIELDKLEYDQTKVASFHSDNSFSESNETEGISNVEENNLVSKSENYNEQSLLESQCNQESIIQSSPLSSPQISEEEKLVENKPPAKIVTIFPYGPDNYSYCFHGSTTDIFFDFGEAKIANHLNMNDRKMSIFLTHYHHDHTAGIYDFKQKATIYGTPKTQYKDHIVKDLEEIKIDQFEILCIHTPCHSRDHFCYRVFDTIHQNRYLISGDCIFLAGTGKFFEGTGQEMVACIEKLLKVCNGDEILLGGHEYAENNLQFTLTIEPNNEDAKIKYNWCHERGLKDLTSYGHSTLHDELKYNVFFRWKEDSIKEVSKLEVPGKILEWLRQEKSTFDSRHH